MTAWPAIRTTPLDPRARNPAEENRRILPRNPRAPNRLGRYVGGVLAASSPSDGLEPDRGIF